MRIKNATSQAPFADSAPIASDMPMNKWIIAR